MIRYINELLLSLPVNTMLILVKVDDFLDPDFIYRILPWSHDKFIENLNDGKTSLTVFGSTNKHFNS